MDRNQPRSGGPRGFAGRSRGSGAAWPAGNAMNAGSTTAGGSSARTGEFGWNDAGDHAEGADHAIGATIEIVGRMGGVAVGADRGADGRPVRRRRMGQGPAVEPGEHHIDQDDHRQASRQRATVGSTQQGKERAPGHRGLVGPFPSEWNYSEVAIRHRPSGLRASQAKRGCTAAGVSRPSAAKTAVTMPAASRPTAAYIASGLP